ncbi:MAG TPA: PadR family transcriptional regulator [Micromonosporaceae bacterium]|jgi:DNA-binding PadR family transcriptional regulator
MPSTLGYALLGLLARRPRTGYELSQALRVPVGYFWTASHSQIYPELARLEADRLIASTVVPGPGPRDTKRYAITRTGRAALAEWVVVPVSDDHSRSEELLKVYSIWLADPGRARAMVADRLRRHRELLAHYESIAAEFERDAPVDPTQPRFGDVATLRYGLAYERHYIEWYEWLAGQLPDA